MDFQQPHRYTRPPPPSISDQHHYQPPAQPSQPVPPPGPLFSGQFQYHPSKQSPSPPSHHQQWAPPPQSDHLPPPPYILHNHQYPPSLPPRPHVPPHHPHSHIPQSYPQVNQDWGNPNWGHHQGWEYPVHNHEEDWAAKARAWAASKAATDNQSPQSQFTLVGRPEEQSHYHSQYLQNVDPHYSDVQQPLLTASDYTQHPPSVVTPPHRTPFVGHLQESASFSSRYAPDGYIPYKARDGTLAGDSNPTFPHQESSPTSLSVHQQEVPSSYSSVAGKEDAADQNEKFYNSLPLSIVSNLQHHAPPPPPAVARSVLMEQAHYAFGNQSVEPSTDLSDQPLDFAPRFSHDHVSHVQPNYTHAWTPSAAPGVVYRPIPPVIPSGPQDQPAVAVPSPLSGHSGPIFGRMPGPSFQPTIPSATASFGNGAGTILHPTTAFPGDAYGASGVPERPKKAPVPNWLREEIIKKKSVIASSGLELSKEESISVEDEGVDKSLRKGNQADSKSIDSSRSTEDDDDDEDNVEAARTAAINQEIKRVLTEVLLKVTDELFDEIATKVLSEDDLTVEVHHNGAASNHRVSPSTPAVQTPKASAKVLIPAKPKETDADDVSEKSTSSSPGDVLGLGSYASDGDEDDTIQSSGVPNSNGSNVRQQPTTKKLLENIHVVENGSSKAKTEEHGKTRIDVESNASKISPNGTMVNHSSIVSEMSDRRDGKESEHGDIGTRYSSKSASVAEEYGTNIDGERVLDGSDVSKSKVSIGEKASIRTELPVGSSNVKRSISDDSQSRETRNKPDKNDRYETKRSFAGKDFAKEVESGKDRTYGKGDENHKRQEERHVRKERTDDRNGSKDRMKEQSIRSGEKAKDSNSRKRFTHPDVKEDRKKTERDRRASVKEDNDRKRERTKDEKGERLRHKLAGDLSRHKRRRSSSVGSRGRNSKDNSAVSHANDSSDGSSDDSKRKEHSKGRNLSPSPIRSMRRQVSRSPHSKHSQRRHSPYSSLETTRGRRSRSRSPVRRQR